MELTDPWFQAEFIRSEEQQGDRPAAWHCQGGTIFGAQGLYLICPCKAGHSLIVTFANPQGASPCSDNFGMRLRGNPSAPGPRWQMSGSGLHDLTLSPSVSTGDPECWHGFIIAGEVRTR